MSWRKNKLLQMQIDYILIGLQAAELVRRFQEYQN